MATVGASFTVRSGKATELAGRSSVSLARSWGAGKDPGKGPDCRQLILVLRGEVPVAVRESMLLWVGCIAGALEDSVYIAKLAKAGFDDIDIEPTRVYNLDTTPITPTRQRVDTKVEIVEGAKTLPMADSQHLPQPA